MFANQTWKPPLLRKGKEVAELLEAVLWGKELDLACLFGELPLGGDAPEQVPKRGFELAEPVAEQMRRRPGQREDGCDDVVFGTLVHVRRNR